MMENMGYRQERLKDIVEKEAEKKEEPVAVKEEEKGEAKEQQQDDDHEQYDTVAKIKIVREGKRLKLFRVTANLNYPNTRMVMDNITSHIEMRVKWQW